MVLNKDLSKHFFMKINFERASIVDKKIKLFARAVREIFNFLLGNMTFGPPCMYLIRIIFDKFLDITNDKIAVNHIFNLKI